MLGVSPNAEQHQIRAAYLALMRRHHPDHRPGDPRAGREARRVNAAYAVLGDARRRAAYDRSRALPSAPAGEPRQRLEPRTGPATVIGGYSDDRQHYHQDVTRALLQVGAGVFVVALVLLLLLA